MQKNAEEAAESSSKMLFLPGTQLNNLFDIKHLISSGGFGQVYSGTMKSTGELVAIKAESINAKIPIMHIEASCLEALNRAIRQAYQKLPKEPIPIYYGCGETSHIRYVVMSLCGKNIRELKKSTKEDRFSMTTSLWLMKKMISALKFLHRLGWIHRDVKPANFCIGRRMYGRQELYLVDFGMARNIIARNGILKARRDYCAFHGTLRYASLTTHRNQDMSRFDDLWPVYYITVENMIGYLPWRYVSEKNQVEKMKENIDLLRQGYGAEVNPPASLVVFHRHLCHASFYHEPKYDQMINEIDLDLAQRKFTSDSRLDWQTKLEPFESIASSDFEGKNHIKMVASHKSDHNHKQNHTIWDHDDERAANEDRSYYFMEPFKDF